MLSPYDETPSIFDAHDELLHHEALENAAELRLAGAFISALVKAVKALRFYPPDSPLVQSFVDDFDSTCRAFLAEYAIFVLQIGEASFSYDDRVCYINADWKSSLPFILYNAGLRELRFHDGIAPEELRKLLELIRRSYDLNPQEDDLVIMLWEQDFQHIDYLALDDLRDETASLVPKSVDQFRQRMICSRAVDRDELSEFPEVRPAAPQAPAACYDPSLYTLTPEEMARLQAEVEAETAPTFVFNSADILLEMVFLARDEAAARTAVGILLRMLDAMLTLGDFARAEGLLARLRAALTETDGQTPVQRLALQHLFTEAAARPRIERIGRLLLRGDHDLLVAAHRYLLQLTAEAIPPLVHLLEEARDTYLRRMLCDVLVELGRQRVPAFFPFLDDARWFVIRNIVFILGRIGDPAALPRLVPLLQHAEPRVRQETAQALGYLRDTRSVIALGNALQDADEVTRSIAAFSLGKIGTPNALAHLLQTVQSREFRKKNPVEMKAFFDGLGLTGATGAVPVLAQLLQFHPLFGRDKAELIRRGAAETLAMIGTPAALAVLHEGSRAPDAAVRQACEAALHAIPTRVDPYEP